MASGGEPFYMDPTFWVAGSFAAFVGIGLWYRVHKSIAAMLDARGEAISKQLTEARSLREEAEKSLSDAQARQREAQREADNIVAQAKEDADLMVAATTEQIASLIERRTKAAEDKIAQAEAHALKQVRAAAVDVAVSAAESVLSDKLKGRDGSALITKSIGDIEDKLH